jgi:hypothetical protein
MAILNRLRVMQLENNQQLAKIILSYPISSARTNIFEPFEPSCIQS